MKQLPGLLPIDTRQDEEPKIEMHCQQKEKFRRRMNKRCPQEDFDKLLQTRCAF